MSKKVEIPHYLQHDMSALHRLIFVSWIVFIAFLLFAIISVVSLLYTGKNLDKLIERNLVPAIDNSRIALDIGRSLADVNFILSACGNEEFSGERMSSNILISLMSLAGDINDEVLNESLILFIDQFESTFANCQSIRQTKGDLKLANEQLLNTISSLDKAVANLIIEDRLKGKDTSILERLPLSITNFMHIQLRLNSLFSVLGDVFLKKELTKRHHLVSTTLAEFALEARILSGYGKGIERYGNQIKSLLQVLKGLAEQYSQVAEEFFSGKQKLTTAQKSLLKHLETAESSLYVSSQQRAKSLKKNFIWIPFASFLLISLPLVIVLFSAKLARSAYKSLKRTWGMRDKAEENLQKAHRDLEIRVKERTAELANANKTLKDEIAERIEIERALKKREFQLIETQTVAQIGNWELDLVTPKLDWSNETYKLFDKDPKNFSPSFDEYASLVHPNDLQTMQTKFNDALESDEKPYHVEIRIINDSGREWVMEAFGKVTRNDNGKALSIFGTAQDVTERSLVEALRKSEKRFKDLAENSTDLIWEFNENEIFTYASPSIKNLLGYLPEEIIGQSAFDPMSSTEAERVMKEFALHKDARESFSALINVNQHKNGNEVILESSGVPIVDSEGGYHGYRGIDRDITERKKMETQLQQAQKMEAIGTLAGGIAHDFNNILGAIIGYTEMAKDDSPAKSSVARDLNKVLEASYRATGLVEQILSFSRQDETEYILLPPANVVKKAITLLLPMLPATIEITQDIDRETGLIFADPTQIHQILMNLCVNAFHAMEETGGKLGISLKEVTISTKDLMHEPDAEPGTFVQISISDSGPGIAPEIKKKIFDPYFTTKETGKGTGMGLAIVYGIAKSYGGFISLESEPGEDTSFHVFIPVIEKELVPEIDDVKPIPIGRDRILFIDDEEILAEMGKSMLERLGYHVTVRNNSIEALETFQNQPDLFDLVITDQTMPGMTGADIARRMIQIRPDIPIILCTGYSTVISEEKAKSMGIKEFALKPLSKKDIAVLIRKVLDNS